jgi:hypothetical protein
LFVPVAIHNNAEGEDERVLKLFSEPAWNNPVVRFLDAQGKDVIPRKDRVWTAAELAPRMSAALKAAKKPVPRWWQLAELDARAEELPRAVFSMHCFWVGQEKLGALEGVADVRPAFHGELEVVDVRFDPAQLPLAKLIATAEQACAADRMWLGDEAQFKSARELAGKRAALLDFEPKPAPESDDLRALKRSPWAKLEMARCQALRCNAALAAGEQAPTALLSPRQSERAAKLREQKGD